MCFCDTGYTDNWNAHCKVIAVKIITGYAKVMIKRESGSDVQNLLYTAIDRKKIWDVLFQAYAFDNTGPYTAFLAENCRIRTSG
jgi:hypothetical protein